MDSLIEKINYIRQKGYTVKFLAEQINVSPNTLYAYMGQREYNLSNKNKQLLEDFIDSLEIDENRKYTVYIHKNKINGKQYIGLTSQHNPTARWRNGKGYQQQPKFYNAILKYGWDNFEHIIVKTNLTREEASNLEKNLIIQYDTQNDKKGYNNRDGGIEKYTLTEEQRKIRAWAKGKKFSKEHCKNISNGLKNRVFSEEAKKKMSEAKLIAGTFQGKNNPKAQKVICIETNQIFDTIKEASEIMCINRDSISKTCRGIQKKAGGYHWRYYN